MRLRAACWLAWSFAALPLVAETVTLEATRDATLIEHPAGALANGSGPACFAGRTAQAENSVRRALVFFDVAAALPEHALIEDVALTMYLNPSNADPRVVRLARVLADWGEGPSASSGGGGAPARPGDASWLHTFWDGELWVQPGGQFLGRDSAEREIAGPGFYIWNSRLHMVQDVQLWASAPERNFGWILIGDETAPQTTKSFASREEPDPALRPSLRITYRPAGAPREP